MPDRLVISYQTTNMHHDKLEQAELADKIDELQSRSAQHILCHKVTGEVVCVAREGCENCEECPYART
jgi:hypothetical protein